METTVALFLVSAPSNLGLRPPEPTAVPGTARAPEALREAGLFTRLAESVEVVDLGVVLPGRYRDDAAPGRLRNEPQIIDHAKRLADRLDQAVGGRLLVLGGDCSILLGAGLHLRRRGRYGLLHVDGHTDYRHPGNSPDCAALAGEDLAAAVGKHWAAVADIDSASPYFDPADVVHIGCRTDDEHLAETRADLGAVVTAAEWIVDPDAAATRIDGVLARPGLDGYWLHLDVDVLDPQWMPAVDSPDPGGLTFGQLQGLLQRYWPAAAGVQVCVFDPDLDPGGWLARQLADLLVLVVSAPP